MWVLEPQDREIKREVGSEEKGKYLFHRVEVDDPRSIYYFLMGLRDLNVDDFQELYDDRWRGFQRFAKFLNQVDWINTENVESLVDELIEVFIWMHFGFWLDAVVDKGLAFDQLKYINEGFHDMLKNEAIRDLPREDRIDPFRKDVPAGKVLNLSRQKDKEIYAVLERIRSRPEVVIVFENEDVAEIKSELQRSFPEVFDIIDGWSMKYKAQSEDLRVFSDTDYYLNDLRGRLRNANMMTLELLASLYEKYLESRGQVAAEPDEIRENNEDLYLLLRGQARLLAARSHHPSWSELPQEEKATALSAVPEEEPEDQIPQVLKDIHGLLASWGKQRKTAKDILENFPRLKKILALLKMEVTLREDGHHLIVPYQRKIARMMLKAGQGRPEILDRPEDVFEISTDELIALVREENPAYIKRTFERWDLLEEAELKLKAQWHANPREALEDFEQSVAKAGEILEWQSGQAKLERVKKSYISEKRRLEHRVQRLRNIIQGNSTLPNGR